MSGDAIRKSQSGAATRERIEHSARRGRLTCCDAAPSGGEGRQQKGRGVSKKCNKRRRRGNARGTARSTHHLRRGAGRRGRRARRRGSVSGEVIWCGDEEMRTLNEHSARRGRLTCCDAAPRRSTERQQTGRGVSGAASRSGDNGTHEAQRAAGSHPAMRRRAGREGRQQKGRGVSGVATTRSAATGKHAKVSLPRPCIHERARGAHPISASASSTTSSPFSKIQGRRWTTVRTGSQGNRLGKGGPSVAETGPAAGRLLGSGSVGCMRTECGGKLQFIANLLEEAPLPVRHLLGLLLEHGDGLAHHPQEPAVLREDRQDLLALCGRRAAGGGRRAAGGGREWADARCPPGAGGREKGRRAALPLPRSEMAFPSPAAARAPAAQRRSSATARAAARGESGERAIGAGLGRQGRPSNQDEAR